MQCFDGEKLPSNAMKAFLLSCFLFVHSVAEVCQKLDQCSCKKNSGQIISLWEIDGGSNPAFKNIVTTSPPGTRFLFDWNPCTKFNEGDGCQDVLICQTDPDVAGHTSPCADSVVDFKVENDGTTTIKYEELTDKSGYKRTVSINLKCDEGQSPGDISGVKEDFIPKDSKYRATLTSRCACDDGCPYPGETGGSTGLSTGSILLIMFFVLLIVYVIGGILVNKFKMGVESMPEMCPNYQFWAGIPSLIKAGVVFSCSSVKSACLSLYRKCNKDSYAKV